MAIDQQKNNVKVMLPFAEARVQLEKQIEDYLDNSGQSTLQLPAFVFEKGQTKFSFSSPSIEPSLFYDAMGMISKHVETLRTHTFEDDFVVLQESGPLAEPRRNIMEGIRFRFIFLANHRRVEVYKQADFSQDELQICVKLFQLFCPSKGGASTKPHKRLQALGAQVYFYEDMQEANAKANSAFLSSKKDSLTKSDQLALFSKDFAGYSRVKEEILENIVLPLKYPQIFDQVAKATRGQTARNQARAVLFQGPAGVGKTTMARLVAQESNIPMVYIPVENILSKYYGESAQNLAEIFDTAALYERALIFVDEIDSLATSREQGLFEATRRLLSVLLRKIDGLELGSKGGVLTIGATNRTEDLDQALISRFDSVIYFPLPDTEERASIFHQYAHHLADRDLKLLAQISQGLAGRNIEDICEYTERRWARRLISEKKAVCPPPNELYLEVTKHIQKDKEP